jgi:hypothetical protein
MYVPDVKAVWVLEHVLIPVSRLVQRNDTLTRPVQAAVGKGRAACAHLECDFDAIGTIVAGKAICQICLSQALD